MGFSTVVPERHSIMNRSATRPICVASLPRSVISETELPRHHLVSGSLENIKLANRHLSAAPKIPSLPDPRWETSRSAYPPASVSGYGQSSVAPRRCAARRLRFSVSPSTVQYLQSRRCRHASRRPCHKSLVFPAPRSPPPPLAPPAPLPPHSQSPTTPR